METVIGRIAEELVERHSGHKRSTEKSMVLATKNCKV